MVQSLGTGGHRDDRNQTFWAVKLSGLSESAKMSGEVKTEQWPAHKIYDSKSTGNATRA